MDFYLIGIDYQRANIELREELYRKRKDIYSLLSRYFQDSAMISTCNRIEIYGLGNDPGTLSRGLSGWYLIKGKAKVFRHALRLAAGLESQLRGEKEILKQLGTWRAALPQSLSNVWKRAYFDALDLRGQSGLDKEHDNISTFLYRDIERLGLKDKILKVIVVGTGKIAELLAKNSPKNIDLYFVSHKNKLRALELADYSQGNVLGFEALAAYLQEADILISATVSPHYIITKDKIQSALLNRDNPLYIYDLGFPRGIEPQAEEINGVVLKNLDDFSPDFEKYNKTIREKLNLAEYLVEERVKVYEESVEAGESAEPVSLASGR
jgi:glutamyl-tRNA reductase